MTDLDVAWKELILDALASDGPITGFRIDRDPDGLPRVHVDQSEPSR
jgi:hypothetical protein